MPSSTALEKMLAGEVYSCLDPDLEPERRGIKALPGSPMQPKPCRNV